MAALFPLRGDSPLGRRPTPWEALVCLAAWVVVDRGAGLVWSRFVNPHAPPTGARLYVIVAGLRAVETALLLLYGKWRGWNLADFGLQGPKAAKGLRVGVLWSLACGALVLALEAAFRLGPGMSFLALVAPKKAVGQELASLLVAGGLFGPVFEELLFRGVLYGGLRTRVGAIPATAISAALFASAHYSFQTLQPVQAVGGLLFCAAYEASGSLWAPLIIHMAGNTVMFLLPLVLR